LLPPLLLHHSLHTLLGDGFELGVVRDGRRFCGLLAAHRNRGKQDKRQNDGEGLNAPRRRKQTEKRVNGHPRILPDMRRRRDTSSLSS
jgi:hypothetical protein